MMGQNKDRQACNRRLETVVRRLTLQRKTIGANDNVAPRLALAA